MDFLKTLFGEKEPTIYDYLKNVEDILADM